MSAGVLYSEGYKKLCESLRRECLSQHIGTHVRGWGIKKEEQVSPAGKLPQYLGGGRTVAGTRGMAVEFMRFGTFN